MIKNGLQVFNGKRLLMLQGPIGPFFRRISRDFEKAGAAVYKINFNGGDWLFNPGSSILFRGSLDEWPAFLESTLDKYDIDMVFLFGDCRPVHRAVKAITTRRGLKTGVFEEGYVRPDYITLELYGTNGHSLLPRDPAFYLTQPISFISPTKPVGSGTYWYMALWAVLYYIAGAVFKPLFPHYCHHRPFTLKEALPWIRSAFRKYYYRIKERGIEEKLAGSFTGKYFLVPLQVHNDSQIEVHSDFASPRVFIETVVDSFRKHAPQGTILVIKHHPLDRGYVDYQQLVNQLIRKHALQNKLLYIHDQHLPSLLEHAQGVVVINSTVGLSALDQGKPLKVLGSALYNMNGLTFQGSLDEFWNQAPTHQLDRNLFYRFRRYVIAQTQLNGSYYKRLDSTESGAGLIWEGAGQKNSAKKPQFQSMEPIEIIRLP